MVSLVWCGSRNLLWTARHKYASGSTSGDGSVTESVHRTYNTSADIYDVDVLTGSTLVREGIEAEQHEKEIHLVLVGAIAIVAGLLVTLCLYTLITWKLFLK